MKDVLSTHETKIEQMNDRNDEYVRKFSDLEKKLEQLKRETTRKMAEIENSVKDEIETVKSDFKELSKKVTSALLKDDSSRISDLESMFRKESYESAKWKSELEGKLNAIGLEMDKVRKDALELCGPGEIEDLHKEIVKVSADLAFESKKLNGIEEIITTQRKELFNNVSEVEGYFISKIETLKRNVNGIAQKISYQIT